MASVSAGKEQMQRSGQGCQHLWKGTAMQVKYLGYENESTTVGGDSGSKLGRQTVPALHVVHQECELVLHPKGSHPSVGSEA